MASTIRDIAREANVSTAAVSRVLHGKGGTIRVSEEKAQLIRDVAERLEYVPNLLARNLRQGRSMNIGLVFENFGSISAGPLYYAYLFDGIASVLFGNHYRLTILPEIDHVNGLPELGNGQLDGVIWCKYVHDKRIMRMLSRTKIPIVALNSPNGALHENSFGVGCDNEKGSELLVDHLYNLGHRKIGFVSEINEESTPDAVARWIGFQNAMQRRGLTISDKDILTWSYESTEFVTWWNSAPEHTALYAWNEGQAGNILRRAMNAGVDIPNEISVAGFDSTSYCETTHPTMTAVNQPIRKMAQHAANTLISMIEGESPSFASVTFPCTLDVRGSTAPARSEQS
jgi:LacI family transcriptional regulator